MSSKTRKLIWSVPLMATLAVVGALAVFVALGLPNADPVQAQSFELEPSAPEIRLVKPGPTMVTVYWRDPEDVGIPAVNGWSLQYIQSATEPAAGAVWLDGPSPGATATDDEIEDLMNGMPYFVRIAATSDALVGPYSVSGPHTPGDIPQAAPTDLELTPGRDGTSLMVSWTDVGDDVASDGGSPITGYKWRYRTSEVVIDGSPTTDAGDWMPGEAGADVPDPAVITDLDSEKSYDVQLVAVNAVGSAAFDADFDAAEEDNATAMTNVAPPPDISGLTFSAVIKSDSTTSSGGPELKVVFDTLTEDLPVGSSIVLYLEDDFQEPDSIPASSVYFVADSPTNVQTGKGARVYPTIAPSLKTGAYLDADKKDIAVRVFIPDMCTDSGASGEENPCAGPNGPEGGQRLTLVIENTSGIKNPSEAGTHSVYFDVLGSADSIPSASNVRERNDALRDMDTAAKEMTPPGMANNEQTVSTVAKVGLSAVNNKRGYEMIVTGTGYNDGTTATAYVLSMPTAAQWWDSLDCAEMNMVAGSMDTEGNGYCRMYANLGATEMTVVKTKFDALKPGFKLGANGCDVVVANGTSIGTATVGGDDTAAIPVTITVPTFKPGKTNYICISDGESRGSGADVEIFGLDDRIRVVPEEVNAGDTVTLFAEDFIYKSGAANSFFQLKLGNEVVSHSINAIGPDGSASGTFVMPATIGGNPIAGIIRVDAQWGDKDGPKADTKITVKPAGLTLTRTEARANESITIQGNGFSNTSEIRPENITIDDVALMVDADSLRDDVVKISNGGQFVATIYLWPESSTTNPALVTGTHTIRVEDEHGFVGTTPLTILEPTITVVPLVAGPRDIVVIRGENFPVDNLEGGAVKAVEITVKDSRERNYSEIPDGSGRFVVEHRVSSNVAIPSVATIKATYGSEITKTGSFQVPEAIITVEPALAAPGDSLTLSVGGMPVYASVDSITIGGRETLGNQNINTDREGAVTAEGIVVPGLDPGIFSVQLEVNDIVAIGQVEIVSEGPTGLANPLPGAMEAIGDELVRVFYFNGVDKTWSFFDPRPEFDGLNTLTTMVSGQPYWILVSEDVDDVVLNNKTRNLTCVGGDCWNQLVW